MKMKRKIYVVAIICIFTIWFGAMHLIKKNDVKDSFNIRYEYQDGWGGTINQIIEIRDLEYKYSLLIEEHYEEEDTNINKDGGITEDKSDKLEELFKSENKDWKKKNKKIKKFLDCTSDMPYEHLVITRKGATIELSYLPTSMKMILEEIIGEHIYCAIEQTYNEGGGREDEIRI